MSDQMTSRRWVRRALAGQQTDAAAEEAPRRVGQLELAAFQGRAARRGTAIARRLGGVIVADAVGLGKTRVCLAVAEALLRDARLGSGMAAGPLLVCVPARLREQWRRKLQQAGLGRAHLVSHTALSRGDVDGSLDPATIVVDEAHRFRNPKAKRSRRLGDLTTRAPVVMATATPVCNSIWDLYHLMALFLAEHDLRRQTGYDLRDAFERAEQGGFDLTELVEEVVIRRTTPPDEGAFGDRPSVRLDLLSYEPGEREAWLWQHLEGELRDLTFEACRGDWPRQLFIEYALRRWESGPEALQETVDGLVEYHRRWREARRHGRRLDRATFRRLFDDPGGFGQEVFPFLFPEGADEPEEVDEAAVAADLERLEALADRLEAVVAGSAGPRAAIAELAADREGKLLVFTRYRRAARGIFRALEERLGPHGRLALVTGDESRATGLGRCGTDEIVRRFAPRARGEQPPEAHQEIRVLVATDCLSEGVNLQDCGAVVLADLPYSALVVEQRIGRLVRPGSPHDEVRVFLPRPASWSDTLGLRRRLRRKLAHAEASGAEMTAAAGIGAFGGEERAEGEAPVRADLAQSASGADRGRSGAEQMARPTESLEPLAALTKLDALAARLGPPEQEGPVEGFWRAAAPVDDRCLWGIVREEAGRQPQYRFLLVDGEGVVEHRRGRLVDSLVTLADADLSCEPADPPGPLMEAAESWVESREARLDAVRRAPVPLDWESPQYRLWRRICGWIESGEIEEGAVPTGGADRLRERLLRPFPHGTRRRLSDLLQAEMPPERSLREVERVVGRFDGVSGPVDLTVVGGLWLHPRLSRPP